MAQVANLSQKRHSHSLHSYCHSDSDLSGEESANEEQETNLIEMLKLGHQIPPAGRYDRKLLAFLGCSQLQATNNLDSQYSN
ncbi:MAG: hypothetical protein HN600_06675 [Bacteroidetes bacterium]|nr:hypothetical protein [Bacteroidota bacterium]